MHYLLASVLLTLLTWGPASLAGESSWSTEYDQYFRKYAKRYFGPNVDWQWFKAQGIAESALRDDANSPAGAKGIMQILPSTFEEIREKNPQFFSIDEPAPGYCFLQSPTRPGSADPISQIAAGTGTAVVVVIS